VNDPGLVQPGSLQRQVEWSSPGFVDSYGLADSSGSRVLLS
jgi:hypothetical protein